MKFIGVKVQNIAIESHISDLLNDLYEKSVSKTFILNILHQFKLKGNHKNSENF
jgi:hypothetical protein